MTLRDDDEFTTLEARLRQDLAPLADVLLTQAGSDTVLAKRSLVANASATEPDHATQLDQVAPAPRRPLRWVLAAAAVLLLAAAAAAIWQAADNGNRIETGPIAPGPDDEQGDGQNRASDGDGQSAQQLTLGEWSSLPAAPDGVRVRGHMVSVWTGEEALFWGGRSGDENTPEAHVGGVAFNPTTDTWREIDAPQWGHPGSTGVYLDGWLYVAAKRTVTRFNPDTGAEEEIAISPTLLAPTLASDGSQVVAFGSASGGFGFQAVGPNLGELQVIEATDELTAALAATEGLVDVLGWARNEFVVAMPDLSVWMLSLDGTLSRKVPPPTGAGYRRVELVNTSDGPRVVHLADDGQAVDLFGPVDGVEWGLSVGVGDFRGATVAGAGEWVVLVLPGVNPIVLAPPVAELGPAVTSAAVEPPLGGLNPNAVWTGDELIVWGGNQGSDSEGQSGDEVGAEGGRLRLPDARVVREGAMDSDLNDQASESATDSAADESEFEILQRLIEQLSDDERIPAGPYDDSGRERFDYQWTDDGLWVYSRPDPAQPGPAREAGEILLLGDWGGPLIDSWLLGYFPGGYSGQIEVSDDAVYCTFVGDGGLPDSMACRLDRTTGELALTIYPSEIDGGDEAFYTDSYADSPVTWQLVPAADAAAAGRPFGSLYLDGAASLGEAPSRPAMVDETRLVRLDPETLAAVEAADIADVVQSGGRRHPCPHEGGEAPPAPDSDLPAAVEATRLALLEAAATCDVETLEALSGGRVSVPASDGGWGMVALAAMLTLEPEVVQGGPDEGGQKVYLFPSSAAGVSWIEFQALSRLYGPDGDDHLTIILEDGTWQVTAL